MIWKCISKRSIAEFPRCSQLIGRICAGERNVVKGPKGDKKGDKDGKGKGKDGKGKGKGKGKNKSFGNLAWRAM